MNLQGDYVGYISAFLGGVITGFSPCVFPLIPITLAFIGVKAGSSRLRGLILSLVYVLGLAVTYSLLGLFAALTGRLFGKVAEHPVSFFIIGNVCIIAGLSFLEAININFMDLGLQNKIKMTGGIFSVFLLGAASGLVAGPCTTPVLGTILVYVASKQNILYGASLLFVFAYGMGFLLILVGTFGAAFLSLPKSGIWLVRLKRISGFILIGVGEYFFIQAGRLMW
ncbi:MAG: sulfite exporter TauE/SafE family protein [Candidatus Omnitrophica bacterium]|nr:sulfite exporter TauE/SafE family protein [Candidatus Omnitrophota bacterium]